MKKLTPEKEALLQQIVGSEDYKTDPEYRKQIEQELEILLGTGPAVEEVNLEPKP